MLLAGATAVQIASVIYLHGPESINSMLTELEEWMQSKQFLNIDQFRGRLSRDEVKNPAEFERVQFMKHFSNKKM